MRDRGAESVHRRYLQPVELLADSQRLLFLHAHRRPDIAVFANADLRLVLRRVERMHSRLLC